MRGRVSTTERNRTLTDGLSHAAYPGWYEDPEAPDLLRWWDGTRWSDDAFRPKPLTDERANPYAAPTSVSASQGMTMRVDDTPTALAHSPSATTLRLFLRLWSHIYIR